MRILAVMALGLGLAVPAARADIPPLPGEQERQLASVIEAAGLRCGKVASFKPAQDADISSADMDAFTVVCTNGATYLVAVPRRRPGPPILDPSGKPLPYPDPVVKQIGK